MPARKSKPAAPANPSRQVARLNTAGRTAYPVATSGYLDDLLADWKIVNDRRVRAGQISRATANTYEQGVGRFLAWCRERNVKGVMPATVEEWIAELRAAGLKAGSINTWLFSLKAFFEWAVSEGHSPVNPVAGIKSLALRGKRQHKRGVLSDDEVVALFKTFDPDKLTDLRNRAIVAVMAFAALRSVEVHRLNLGNLRTSANRIALDIHGKGREEAGETVYLLDRAAIGYLRAWLAKRGKGKPDDPVFTSLSNRTMRGRISLASIRHIVVTCYQQAGVVIGVGDRRKTTHSLRHTAITAALRGGAAIQKVSRFARHGSIDTTMIYAHELDREANPAEASIHYDAQEDLPDAS